MPNYGTTTSGTPLQRQRPKLGRQYAPDPRDRAYAMTADRLKQLQKATGVSARKPHTRPWHIGEILDQGNTSECVAHAYMAFVEAAPIFHKSLGWTRAQRTELYQAAQKIDGFPMPHDGTTARAVLSVAKSRGWIAEYLWITDEDTAREYLLTRGGLMAGTDWFDSMFATDKHGYVEPSGNVAGGHEYFVRWYYNAKHRIYPDTYEFQQSWGDSWGDAGRFRMKAEAFHYLLWQLNGDLVLPAEVAVVKPKAAA